MVSVVLIYSLHISSEIYYKRFLGTKCSNEGIFSSRELNSLIISITVTINETACFRFIEKHARFASIKLNSPK